MENIDLNDIDLNGAINAPEKSPLKREKLQQVFRLLKSVKGEQLAPLIEKKFPELGSLRGDDGELYFPWWTGAESNLGTVVDGQVHYLSTHSRQVAEWVSLSYEVGINPLAVLRQDGWDTAWGVPTVAPTKATVIVLPHEGGQFVGVYSPTFGWLADDGVSQYCSF